jgi:uncharacterized protein YjbJ (UPF0337 family)
MLHGCPHGNQVLIVFSEGKVTNNPNLEAEGKAEHTTGKVEKKLGQIEKVFEK